MCPDQEFNPRPFTLWDNAQTSEPHQPEQLVSNLNTGILTLEFNSFKKKLFIYLFLERGEGREKRRERNINVWFASHVPPTGDLARNPGMCPDWDLATL